MKKNLQPLLWGLALISIGIIVLLNITGVTNISIWTYIIGIIFIFSGISSIINSKKSVFGYFLILLGVFIILRRIFDIDFRWVYIIPIIIILAGISFISSIFIHKSSKVAPSGSSFVVFSGREDTSFPPDYKGSSITCIFGGYDIDLRYHTFTSDVHYNIFTMFGGTEISVPENVNIVLNPTAIFGGVSNYTDNQTGNEFTVYVNALCIFGGVEVNNRKKRK